MYIIVARPGRLVFRGRVADFRQWLKALTGEWREDGTHQGLGPGPVSGRGPALAAILAAWTPAAPAARKK